MTKLPTAEEIKIQVAAEYGCENYEHDYEFGLGISKLMDQFEFMERVCESHTAAHTAALREDLTQAHLAYFKKSRECTALQERIKEWESLMQEFVDRVDRGEVRSRKTYAKFKEALK
jgi:hypothetical protein